MIKKIWNWLVAEFKPIQKYDLRINQTDVDSFHIEYCWHVTLLGHSCWNKVNIDCNSKSPYLYTGSRNNYHNFKTFELAKAYLEKELIPVSNKDKAQIKKDKERAKEKEAVQGYYYPTRYKKVDY